MSDIDISYGGQAVIGGVLIQSPKGWSLGIRDKDDEIYIDIMNQGFLS